jgi:hypothetical protein
MRRSLGLFVSVADFGPCRAKAQRRNAGSRSLRSPLAVRPAIGLAGGAQLVEAGHGGAVEIGQEMLVMALLLDDAGRRAGPDAGAGAAASGPVAELEKAQVTGGDMAGDLAGLPVVLVDPRLGGALLGGLAHGGTASLVDVGLGDRFRLV